MTTATLDTLQTLTVSHYKLYSRAEMSRWFIRTIATIVYSVLLYISTSAAATISFHQSRKVKVEMTIMISINLRNIQNEPQQRLLARNACSFSVIRTSCTEAVRTFASQRPSCSDTLSTLSLVASVSSLQVGLSTSLRATETQSGQCKISCVPSDESV